MMSVKELLRTLSAFDPYANFPPIETPYSKLFLSNYSASVLEAPAIHDIVSQHRDQVNTIDSILERMWPIVHQLVRIREQTVSSMKTHEAFLSCIRRLPTDILSEIFIWCLPHQKHPSSPDRRVAPMLLTQVCRSWREVALGIPMLWRSVHIAHSSVQAARQPEIYRYWLKNSGGCHLSLTVDLTPTHSWKEKRWKPLANALSKLHAKRCTELTLVVDTADGLDRLLGNVPILEILHLKGKLETMDRTISIVQPRPHLRTLTITSSAFSLETLSFLDPGWANLTHLALLFDAPDAEIDHRIFFALLQMCPNLERLALSHIITHRDDEGHISLTHANLRTLDIWDMCGDSTLLDTLAFPNLRHLHLFDYCTTFGQPLPVLNEPGHRAFSITIEEDATWMNADTIFNLFQPGWTNLTYITLFIGAVEAFGFLPLRFCPNLEYMVVTFSYASHCDHNPLTHDTLRSLTINIVGESSVGRLLDRLTLPNLRDLHLSAKSDWPHEKFKAFISRSGCQLETLVIEGAAISDGEKGEFTSMIPGLKQLELRDAEEELTDDAED